METTLLKLSSGYGILAFLVAAKTGVIIGTNKYTKSEHFGTRLGILVHLYNMIYYALIGTIKFPLYLIDYAVNKHTPFSNSA